LSGERLSGLFVLTIERLRVTVPAAFWIPPPAAALPRGRPQLVMHHFMFGPEWDQGCPSCSPAADGIGRLRQLHVRNTTLVAVSRAPYEKIAGLRERTGWTFPWYSRLSLLIDGELSLVSFAIQRRASGQPEVRVAALAVPESLAGVTISWTRAPATSP
jgi:predicted dithiol-disulfide oxidoreductase (DUF899 family)